MILKNSSGDTAVWAFVIVADRADGYGVVGCTRYREGTIKADECSWSCSSKKTFHYVIRLPYRIQRTFSRTIMVSLALIRKSMSSYP